MSDSDQEVLVPEQNHAAVPSAPLASMRRLVIKDIVMHNFKSYAGTHVVGPFHKTFTAVIGPNGSGKSNVIDAMLFVFGKQAKKIRLEKLSELIHSSAAFPNLTSASVTVNFVEIDDDPTEQKQWVEVGNTAFSVTREVQRNNTSQYFIDGTKQTQKQVVTELIQRGIDLEHNRFLILQGEVEQIALMKPKAEKEGEEGLLEYFDDLIGTNRYIEAIKEATQRAEKCQEDRLSSLDQVEKVRKERETLDSAKQQTIKYAKKDNLVQKLLSVLCQGRVREHESQLEEPRQVVATFDKELEKLSEESRDVESKSKAAAAKTKEAQKAVVIHQRDKELAQQALQKAEDDVAGAKATIEDAEKTRKKENEKMKKLNEEIAKLALDVAGSARDAEIAAAHLADATSELEAKLPDLERRKDDIQQLILPKRKQLEALRREAAPYDNKVAEAEIAVDTARQRLEDCTAALTKAEEEHARTATEFERATQRAAELRRVLDDAKQAKLSFVGELERVEAAMEKAARRTREIDQQIQQIKSQWRENESDDKIAAFLSNQRGLRYRGTLRRLGNLDEKYDIAAGVAGGAHWGFHIVDDQAAATEAVELLRQNNLGRATFLPLDKITRDMEPYLRDQVIPPTGCQRLFDLIQCDKVYAPLFYFAVRNTLVTNDDALARQIGLGKTGGGPKARVVTLQGMLVEPGAVTGGGSAQGARLRASPNSLDRAKLTELLQSLQLQLKEAFEEETRFREQRSSIDAAARARIMNRDEEARLAAELRSLDASLKQLEHRAGLAKRHVEEARQLNTSSAMKEATRAVEVSEEALAHAQNQVASYKQRIKALQEEIDLMGGAEFIALRDRVALLQTTVKEQEAKQNAATNTMQRARVSGERKARELEALRQKMEETAENATKAAKAELEQLMEKASELSQTVKKHQALLREVEAVCEESKNEQTELEQRGKAIAARQRDVESDKQAQLESMRAMLEKIEKLNAKIDSCNEKIINNVIDFGIETIQQDDRAIEGQTEEEQLAPFVNRTFTTRITDASELLGYETEQTTYMVKELGEELTRIRDTIDFNAVTRWREKDSAYKALRAQYDALLEQLEAAEIELSRLKIERKTKFMSTFVEIQKKLKQMYQLLANGGDAEIELLDSSDPFEGINFVVRPPKKAWKNVGNLSGGEKTLSSLALVFALHHVKPTPVYVMDEIDAALDFKNVSIVARYVLERAVGAQFIIISLRNNMFELAHQLVGICKINDCTRSVVVNPGSIAQMIVSRAEQQQQQHAVRRSATQAELDKENRVAKRPPRPEMPLPVPSK